MKTDKKRSVFFSQKFGYEEKEKESAGLQIVYVCVCIHRHADMHSCLIFHW